MSDAGAELNIGGINTLADILLGAAYADGVFVGTEALAIHKILRDLLGTRDLPDSVESHLYDFDPESFDLERACKALELSGANERRTLLALVAEVTNADQIHDLDEDAYIRRVANYIGAPPEEYADLTVEVLSISALTQPPPLPDDAGGSP